MYVYLLVVLSMLLLCLGIAFQRSVCGDELLAVACLAATHTFKVGGACVRKQSPSEVLLSRAIVAFFISSSRKILGKEWKWELHWLDRHYEFISVSANKK